MKKLFKSKIFWGLLVVALILVYFVTRQRPAVNGQETTIVPNRDEVFSPVVKDLRESLTLSGNVDVKNKAEVRFQTSGLLTWVGVKEGDRVRKWQSLAAIDRKELQKRLEQQFNLYRTQLSQFDDTQAEYKDKKDSLTLTDEMKRILDRSQFALNNSVVSYEIADLSLKYASIYSPINGVVVAVEQPNPGVNITPATAAITVADPSSVYLKAEIDQEDVHKIKLDQKATVNIDSYPDETIDSTVTYISFAPIAGRTSATYEVRLTLPTTDQNNFKYRLGMDGDADIFLSEVTGALTIPSDAVTEEDGKKYVLVKNADGKTASRREIKTGVETDMDTQVLEGLSENDQVVVKNN